MRIPIATTLVCSTLSTLAFYQGFVALFSGTHRTDDESASTTNPKKDEATSKQAARAKPAIATPETMKTAKGGDRAKQLVKQDQKLVAAGNASGNASGNNLPTVNVPPTMTPEIAQTIGRTGNSSVAPPETIAPADRSPQASPFSVAAAPLSDVKGHWAESYIAALAAKGVVRGFVDGNFHPDEPVTADQFDIMVQKALIASPIAYSDLMHVSRDRVPTRADAAAFIYQTLARAETTPTATAVQVSGAVPRPGIYAIPPGGKTNLPTADDLPTVSRAIQRAGGTLDGADLAQVQVYRVGETTARHVINVDVQHMLQTGDRSRDLILQQGDKLFIPSATAAARAGNPATGVLPTPGRSVSLVERPK